MYRNAIIRHLDKISPVPTSHNIGLKKVLLSNEETKSSITQIAKTTLNVGENVNKHVHTTMDEHYFFMNGEGTFFLNDLSIDCVPGLFILVPAGFVHGMVAKTKLEFMTVGVAIN